MKGPWNRRYVVAVGVIGVSGMITYYVEANSLRLAINAALETPVSRRAGALFISGRAAMQEKDAPHFKGSKPNSGRAYIFNTLAED